MGGGYGRGLDFGATWGSGKLPLAGFEPETLPEANIQIGRSLGAKALNYDIKDPHTGRIFRFLEGTTIRLCRGVCRQRCKKQTQPKGCFRPESTNWRAPSRLEACQRNRHH